MMPGCFWAGVQTKQGVGEKGVDKRIDVLATAIKAGLTVHDLPEVELAYAPPYSSAKDPVNMAGYVALNLLDGMLETVQWHEIDALVAAGEFVLDVREDAERLAGHIAGIAHIPLHEIRDRLDEIPVDRTIYIYCHAGLRGYLALRILQENGFQAKSLDGGFETYAAAKSGAASHVKERQKDLALIN